MEKKEFNYTAKEFFFDESFPDYPKREKTLGEIFDDMMKNLQDMPCYRVRHDTPLNLSGLGQGVTSYVIIGSRGVGKSMFSNYAMLHDLMEARYGTDTVKRKTRKKQNAH